MRPELLIERLRTMAGNHAACEPCFLVPVHPHIYPRQNSSSGRDGENVYPADLVALLDYIKSLETAVVAKSEALESAVEERNILFT